MNLKCAAAVLTAAGVCAGGICLPAYASDDEVRITIEAENSSGRIISMGEGAAVVTQSNAAASGGSFVTVKTYPDVVFPPEGAAVGYPFTVDEGGIYNISLTASNLSVKELSAYAVKIDGDILGWDYLPVNSSTVTEQGENLGDYLVEYRTSICKQLDPGEHMFYIIMTAPRSAEVDTINARGWLNFDCAVLTKLDGGDLGGGQTLAAVGTKRLARLIPGMSYTPRLEYYDNSGKAYTPQAAVSYTSSNSAAVTVSDGSITAVSAGEAYVKAAAVCGGVTKYDTVRIIVSDGELSAAPDEPLGIFTDTENVSFTLAGSDISAQYTVTDYYGKAVYTGEAENGKISLGVIPRGHYKLSIGGTEDIYFSVVRAGESRRNNDASPFAVDCASLFLVDESEIEDYARAVYLAGIRYIRDRTRWGVINPSPGVYTYDAHDKYYDAFAQYGIKINTVYHSAPAYVKTNTVTLPDDLTEAYNFAKTTAQHFDGTVNSWEVWNEPDIGFTDSGETADKYAALLKAMSIGYHDSGADVNVALSGMAYEPGNYLINVMRSDTAKYFDCYNYHVHRTANTAEEVSAYPSNGQAHKQFCEEYGLYDKPVWVTEAGMSFPVEEDNTELSEREQCLSARYLAVSAIKGLVGGEDKHFWFVFPYYIEKGTSFGTFSAEGEPYSAYNAASAVSNALGNGVYEGELRGLPDNVNGYVFRDGDESVAAIWSAAETEISLITNTASALVTDIMDNETVRTVQDGILNITAGPDMQFIRISGTFPEQTLTKAVKPEKQERAAELSAADRIVITQTYPAEVRSGAKQYGYRLDKNGQTTVTVDVYNFNDSAAAANIYGQSYGGWTVTPAKKGASLPANSKTTFTFTLTSDGTPTNEMTYPVVFSGITKDGEITKSVTQITADDQTTVVPELAVPQYTDVSAWNKNVPLGASQALSVDGDELSMQFTFASSVKDKWAYPTLKFSQVQDFGSYDGIVVNVYCGENAAGSTYRMFLTESGGASYYTSTGYILEDGWQQIIIPFTSFSLNSGTDANSELDIDKIASLKAGLNTTYTGTVEIRLSNFGLYKVSAGRLTGSFESLVYENGVLSGTLSDTQIPYDAETALVYAAGRTYPAQLDGNTFICELPLPADDYEVLAKVTDESGTVIKRRISISAQRFGISCSGAEFTDSAGNAVYTVKGCDEINAGVTVRNNGTDEAGIQLIAGAYDESGRLVHTAAETVSLGGGAELPVRVNIKTDGCAFIKVFLWNARQNVIADIKLIN